MSVSSNICRTCMKTNGEMKSVFSSATYMEKSTSICNVLMEFASVKVCIGDGLPDLVCNQCAQELQKAYTFKTLCETSDTELRSYNVRSSLDDKLKPNLNDDIIFARGDGENSNKISSASDCDQETNEIQIDATATNYVEDTSKDLSGKRGGNELIYNCDECNIPYLELKDYRMHMDTIHKRPSYNCEPCGKFYTTSAILKRHQTLQHKPKDMDTEDDSTKQAERAQKKPNGSNQCTICLKTFRFASNLERHKLIHTGEKPYLCNICGKGFAQLSYLRIHSFTHTGEKPYKCQTCDKSFAAPGTLLTHNRIHTGERPHMCKICGKEFSQSGYLAAHTRTHTGEKPMECKICHMRFNQSGRLIVHMRIHSGEKPFVCDICGRSFAVKGTMIKHMRTHTGERPYDCTECGQKFAQSGTLSTHMKVHKNK